MKFDRKRVMNVFYGNNTKPDILVATVIPSIYQQLSSQIENRKISNGWWKMTKGYYDGVEISLVEVPQRSGIQDAVLSLAPLKDIIFVGYCGSLNTNYDIGNVVYVKTAKKGKYSFDSPNMTEGVILEQMEKLLGEDYEGLDVDVVDMETFDFYKTANDNSECFGSILLVTDMPKVKGKKFYEVDYSVTKRNQIMIKDFIKAYLKGTIISL